MRAGSGAGQVPRPRPIGCDSVTQVGRALLQAGLVAGPGAREHRSYGATWHLGSPIGLDMIGCLPARSHGALSNQCTASVSAGQMARGAHMQARNTGVAEFDQVERDPALLAFIKC